MDAETFHEGVNVLILAVFHTGQRTTAATYKESGSPAPIEVERVVSKITFRHKPAAEDFKEIGSITDGKNLYEIQETKYNYEIVKRNFWFLNEAGIYNYLTKLYKAEAPNGDVYWVYVDSKGTTTRYTDKGTEHTGDLEDQSNVTANIVELAKYDGTLVYVGSKVESNEAPENYYVQLKKYE